MLPFLLLTLSLSAQQQDTKFKWQKEKPGQWIYNYTLAANSADEIHFKKNISNLAEWFHQNIPLLTHPKGFNILINVGRGWDNYYTSSASDYGLSANLDFSFQLFNTNGSTWKSELPQASTYSFTINRLQGSGSWIGPIGQFDNFNDNKHDPRLEKAINDAASRMDEMMVVLPFAQEMSEGIHLYKNASEGHHIVLFNPTRPAYLIPVSLKELAQSYLNYYSLFQTLEIDQMLLNELKKEIASFSQEELNSPAYIGHHSNIVFRYSSDNRNLPIMKLNPDYWDKTLPPSAIQLMVFYFLKVSDNEFETYYERFGYPDNAKILINQINWNNLAQMIQRK